MIFTFYRSEKVRARLEYEDDLVAIHVDKLLPGGLKEAAKAHDDLVKFLDHCGFVWLIAAIPENHKIEKIAKRFGYKKIGDNLWVYRISD